MTAGRILLIDDDPDERWCLVQLLELSGLHVLEAADGGSVHARSARDVGLILFAARALGPGTDAVRAVRDAGVTTPILLISSYSDVDDRIATLDAGADGYLVKPFSVPELLARIRAMLRRDARSARTRAAVLAAGPLAIDVAHRRVSVDGKLVHVTPTELRILVEVVQTPGHLITYEALMALLWGRTSRIRDVQTLRVHVANLRRKLERAVGRPLIETEYTRGCRLAGADARGER